MRGLLLLRACLCALGGDCTAPASAGAGMLPVARATLRRCPWLEPSRTNQLWQRLVASPQPSPLRAPGRLPAAARLFYAATDFLRLATKLAATLSPCADTTSRFPARLGQATAAHAASRLLSTRPANSAHSRGPLRDPRRDGSRAPVRAGTPRGHRGARMAAADYDVAKGDTWVLDELSTSAVVGRGTLAPTSASPTRSLRGRRHAARTRGTVFVVGFGQLAR